MRYLKHITSMAIIGLVILLTPACSTSPAQETFSTPEEAAATLHQALEADNQEQMALIFGRKWLEMAASGDPVSDQFDREVIALAMAQTWHWTQYDEKAMELIIGDEEWPFPILLVKTGDEWQFDSEEGMEEVLARRIGRNELNIMNICYAYVDMQKKYASQPHDNKPAGLFAQRLLSSPGRQDGLYWEKKTGQRRSPLGDLAAGAEATGYDPDKPASAPFWGYYFRILTAQGPAASGGEKSYMMNGDMPDGFALLAYPAKYASSGVMTFMISQDGIVYEKDLGEDTAAQALLLTKYNPDESWTAVHTP